jgi:hypothetical protein
VDMNIMPQGTISNYKQDAFQRNLDPDTFQFWFRGDACNLRALADELRKLDSAVESWLKTHHFWSRLKHDPVLPRFWPDGEPAVGPAAHDWSQVTVLGAA